MSMIIRGITVAKDIILAAMRVVTSADKAFTWLGGGGYDFTRAIVRDAWKVVGEADQWATVLKTWGEDRTPPKAWTTDYKVKEATGYQQVVKYTFEDIETGEREDRFASVHTDKPLKYTDIYNRIEDDLRVYGVVQGKKLVDMEPGGILRYVKEG